MNKTQIIGIILIRNEDVYIKQVITNITDFCDKIIIADNYSTDQTWDIVTKLSRDNPKIRCQRIRHANNSQKLIQEYAGSNTWVFGVDGDEIYDPQRLVKFREQILDGKYDDWWVLFGNVLNCTNINMVKKNATGYLAPPCRSMTKLYNFKIITKWDGPCERLHNGTLRFKKGYNKKRRFKTCDETSWHESLFRCLHLCFLPRSSKDNISVMGRLNVPEVIGKESKGLLEKISLGLIKTGSKTNESNWKKEKYMRGELVTVNISSLLES